jgi:hypothetical protein
MGRARGGGGDVDAQRLGFWGPAMGSGPCTDVEERNEFRKERERERIRQREWSGAFEAGRDICALEKSRETWDLAVHVVAGPPSSASFHQHEIGWLMMSRVTNQTVGAFRVTWHILL